MTCDSRRGMGGAVLLSSRQLFERCLLGFRRLIRAVGTNNTRMTHNKRIPIWLLTISSNK